MKQYDLVIFDWDGTLMDSIGKIITCIENTAKVLQLPIPTQTAIRNIIGLSMTPALQILFPDGLNPHADSTLSGQVPDDAEDDYTVMRAVFKAQYLEFDTTPTPLYPQAQSVLEQLQAQGYQLAVATGKARAGLDRVLSQTGLASYFVDSRCGDEMQSKPNPDMILSLLHALNIAPARALMVGDSLLDLTMAANAGIDSIGVTYGAHSAEQLSQARPKALIDSPSQLLQFL